MRQHGRWLLGRPAASLASSSLSRGQNEEVLLEWSLGQVRRRNVLKFCKNGKITKFCTSKGPSNDGLGAAVMSLKQNKIISHFWNNIRKFRIWKAWECHIFISNCFITDAIVQDLYEKGYKPPNFWKLHWSLGLCHQCLRVCHQHLGVCHQHLGLCQKSKRFITDAIVQD